MESLNRTLETRNLTTSVVAEKLGGDWSLNPRGDHRVKGIGSAFGVFELGTVRKKSPGKE